MNISSISANQITATAGSGKDNKSRIEALEKQIASLQEQIEKISKNDDYDSETKKKKIEKLENQIKNMETQKRTIETEALKPEPIKTEKKTDNQQTNKDGDTLNVSPESSKLIEIGLSMDKIKELSIIKEKMKGDTISLGIEIEMDKGRGVNTDKKEEQLTLLESRISETEKTIGNAIKEASEKAAPDDTNKADKTEVIKDKDKTEENEKEPKSVDKYI